MDAVGLLQVILSVPLADSDRGTSLWLDERILPSYIATASLFILLVRGVWVSKPVRILRGVSTDDKLLELEGGKHKQNHGIVVTAFKVARLAGVLVLLGVSAVTAIKHGLKWLDLALVGTLLYGSILALCNVFASARNSLIFSLHLSLLTFTALAVYAYRDIWPLMTFTLQPKDSAEGELLWAKIGLLIFVGGIVPLFEPYPYIPCDPSDPAATPSPEQTASLASFLTYVWLERIIWHAYSVPHLTHDEFPPLCDYDEIKNLIKQSYPSMDPFSGAKKSRHLFWGLIKIFRQSLLYQAVMLVMIACGRMAGPIGTNRLLAYLENGSENAFVKPWVWILWLGLGPIVDALCFQFYVFLSTGTVTRMESIFTSLIFDHALRIRFKAEVSNKKNGQMSGIATPAGTDIQGATTPHNASEGGSEDDQTVHSRTTTGASTATAASSATSTATTGTAATSSTVTTVAHQALAKGKDKKDSKDTEKAEKGSKKGKNLVGKLNNLATSDLGNITDARDFLFIIISAPLLSCLSMAFLYAVLGWSAFVGLAVMVALIPVPTWLATRMSGMQKEKMKCTDSRVQSVTEVMGVLRMIKLFGWETRVTEIIAEKREDELKWIWKRRLLLVGNSCVNNIIPVVHMVVTYAIYTTVMKEKLTASVVFSSVTAFTMLRNQISRVMYGVPQLITANVSLGRVADFLRDTELLDTYTKTSPDDIVVEASWKHISDIGFGQADFSWSNEKNDGLLTPTRRAFHLRIDDEVMFKEGAFNLIIGPTGSGKTSVLMALLGEMHYMPRGQDSWMNLPRRRGVAYAAQESWVQNETIKNNILFGAPYDEERYKKVIYQCALTRDLSLFDAGDATEVGEKGLTLSGGQKARVTLARAVYSSAKTLLLDDVLAALDVHTSRWIVNKCFKGDLVRGRTAILVTHNIAMASPIADFVIALHDGHIISQGTVSDALGKDEKLAEEFKHDEEALELDETEEIEAGDSMDAVVVPAKGAEGKLVIAEEIAVGHVSWNAFKLFLNGVGGKWPFLFWFQYLGAMGVYDLCEVLETWWLGYWARQYALRDAGEVRVSFYLSMYCVIVAITILVMVYSTLYYTYGTLRASRTIHAKLVERLLGSTFRWLDITPTSRVLARCTQDIQSLDMQVPNQLSYLLMLTVMLIVKLGTVVLFAPVFIIPVVIVAGIGGFLGSVYMRAQLSIKREMSNAKAPVLGAFGSAMAGLTSIRAYAAQDSFKHMLHERIDRYMCASRSFYNVNRWIGIRLDALGRMFTISLAFYLVYGGMKADASTVGFILSLAVSFSDMILSWVRVYNAFEVNGNCLERIQQYIDIDQEPLPKDAGKPPAYWPASGDLRVENLSARYSLDGPKVLQDVSFHAQAGERVGIVGRTGSGKSTLTLAILRCIYTEGSIIYDGIPSDTINLDALRSNITIIPQVPELLSGSLRHNLDMFGQYDDAVLNDALHASGLFSLQGISDENRLTLDSEIASGGGNLSVGQKQIIALARAMVRQSKLLILDEATSAIDYETDAVIQSSLRTELKNDVTVITVAHRLQTIMDYDKIMVLDAGRLVEYDAPKALLETKGSLLRALVDESADKDVLYAMANSKA